MSDQAGTTDGGFWEGGGDDQTLKRCQSVVNAVSDEGIGIDPGDADRVFEVFQSLQGHGDAGTEIGLALVKRIVERHDGDIWVDSEPGEGATFSFTVPAVSETDA